MKFKQGRIPLNFFVEKKEFESFNFENDQLVSKKTHFLKNRFLLKEDPRPIWDKNYIGICIQDLIFFLNKKGFKEPLNIKSLSTPTSRNFFKIIAFLLNEIDPNFDFQKKVEDNFSSLLKEIKYPFPLPKGSRYLIGSSHLWPNLLACLKWITELLEYDSFNQKEKSLNFKKQMKSVWEQLGNAYLTFLHKSEDGERFSKVLISLAKFKINQEKMSNLFWIKKLRAKFRNFLVLRKTFFLLWILDNCKLKILEIFKKISILKNSMKNPSFLIVYHKNQLIKNFKKKFFVNQKFNSKIRKDKELELFFFVQKFFKQAVQSRKRKNNARKKIYFTMIKKILKKINILRNFISKKKIITLEIFYLVKKLITSLKTNRILFSNFFEYFKIEVNIKKKINPRKIFIMLKNLKQGLKYKRMKSFSFQIKKDFMEKEKFFLRKLESEQSQKKKFRSKIISKLFKINNFYNILSDIEEFESKKNIFFFSLISEINILKKIFSKNIFKNYFLFENFFFCKKKIFLLLIFMVKNHI